MIEVLKWLVVVIIICAFFLWANKEHQIANKLREENKELRKEKSKLSNQVRIKGTLAQSLQVKLDRIKGG